AAREQARLEGDDRGSEVVRTVANRRGRGTVSTAVVGAGRSEVVDHDRRVVDQTPPVLARPQRETDLEVPLRAGSSQPAGKRKSLASKSADGPEDHHVASGADPDVMVADQLPPGGDAPDVLR